jgi:hypothetical protein
MTLRSIWRWLVGGRPRYSAEYVAYLRSQEWRVRRARALYLAGYKCERCGMQRGRGGWLEVHHLTYERLGHERDEDLEVLCQPCHRAADRERRANRGWRQWT